MDADEIAFRNEEITLRREEVQLRDVEINKRRSDRWIGGITAFVAVASLIFTIKHTADVQNDTANRAETIAQEAHFTAAQANYDTMVNSLSSPSEAVQVLSVRRLVQFVLDSSNYRAGNCDRYHSVDTLIQTIESIVQARATSYTLKSFKDVGVADLTLRVTRQLVVLTNHVGDVSLGCVDKELATFLSHEDLHGVDLENWRPQTSSSFTIEYSDLRRTNLSKLDLTNAEGGLTDSKLTCANLSFANFGKSNLNLTDLNGANLSGANLSEVTGLTQQQLNHATTNSDTKLPDTPDKSGKLSQPQNSWTPRQCEINVNAMK